MAKPKMRTRKDHAAEDSAISAKGVVREYWETICVVLIFVLFARTWIFQNSNIPSGSMKDTLLVGDRLLVNSFLYGPALSGLEHSFLPVRQVQKGDIVVFKFPGNPQVPFIKRVIARGGDVVQVVNNHVFVNGTMLVEGYTLLPAEVKGAYVEPPPAVAAAAVPELPDFLAQPERFTVESLPDRVEVNIKDPQAMEAMGKAYFGPYRIPQGHLFVMGDNRMNSEDSRYWGALDERMVLGKAWIIWWSFKEGDYDYLRNSPGDMLKRLGDKVGHFFGKTRWGRIGMRPR